jgi:hypothetical protein
MRYSDCFVAQLKFNFISETDLINNNTLFLLRCSKHTHYQVYLLLSFILLKHKKIINEEFYKEISEYVNRFNEHSSIDEILSDHDLVMKSYIIANKLYKKIKIIPRLSIEEYFKENSDISNIIVINKESHDIGKYVCFKNE